MVRSWVRFGWGLGLLASFWVGSLLASSPQRVLLLGDSHLIGDFGKRIESGLRSTPAEISRVSSCGSTLRSWWTRGKTRCGFYARIGDQAPVLKKEAETPDLEQVLKTARPTRVVLVFGTNYISYSSAQVQSDVSRALTLVAESGAECVFVGPPDSRTYRTEVTRINEVLREALGSRCAYFESLGVTSYPERGGDGVHFQNAEVWAEGFLRFWAQLEN